MLGIVPTGSESRLLCRERDISMDLGMIITFTDFGVTGPYLGQMRAVLHHHAPGHAVVDLMTDAPRFDPKASAYVLAALSGYLPGPCVIVAVVDPDVGGPRLPQVLRAGDHWVVGPDNGLMEILRRRSGGQSWRIDWRPAAVSATFHGRDLFAPVAARLACGQTPEHIGCTPHPLSAFADWPDDLAEILYIDHYGNAVTGWRATRADLGAALRLGEGRLFHAARFGAVAPGQAFWYGNSSGLVEIAVNGGSAADTLGLGPGQRFVWA